MSRTTGPPHRPHHEVSQRSGQGLVLGMVHSAEPCIMRQTWTACSCKNVLCHENTYNSPGQAAICYGPRAMHGCREHAYLKQCKIHPMPSAGDTVPFFPGTRRPYPPCSLHAAHGRPSYSPTHAPDDPRTTTPLPGNPR